MKGQLLLIIDVQSGFFQGTPKPHQVEQVIARLNALSAGARAAGVPVIFTQHDGTPEDGYVPHSPGWQLHPELKREAADLVVRKTACDCFYRTSLAETLQGLGARELIISGYATEFCIDSTVRRAASEGFKVVLVSDAHTTTDQEVLKAEQIIAHHNRTLANLAQPGNPIQVKPTREVTF